MLRAPACFRKTVVWRDSSFDIPPADDPTAESIFRWQALLHFSCGGAEHCCPIDGFDRDAPIQAETRTQPTDTRDHKIGSQPATGDRQPKNQQRFQHRTKF